MSDSKNIFRKRLKFDSFFGTHLSISFTVISFLLLNLCFFSSLFLCVENNISIPFQVLPFFLKSIYFADKRFEHYTVSIEIYMPC